MKRLDTLRPGQMPSREQYNELVQRVTALSKITGRSGVTVRPSNNGVAITAGSSLRFKPRKSFVRTTPGATSAVDVYLDTDSATGITHGAEVTVLCEIVGSSALNAAIPRLEDGVMLPVWSDSGVWRPFFPFQGTEDCD